MTEGQVRGVVGVAVGLGGVALWYGFRVPSTTVAPPPSPAPVAAPAAAPELTTPPPFEDTPEQGRVEVPPDRSEAYALLDEEGRFVRCRTKLLPGVYGTARGATAVHDILVMDGVLTARVEAIHGESVLSDAVAPVGTIRWRRAEPDSWGTCATRPPHRVPVSGTVRHADGTPAADASVRGCLEGDLARTNEAGRYVIDGAVGMICHPLPVMEVDGRLGVGVNLNLEVTGPMSGVELTLPARDDWMDTEHLQSEAAGASRFMAAMLARDEATPPEALRVLDGRAGSDAARDVLRTLAADWDAEIARLQTRVDRLSDPSTQAEEVRELWLSQY